MMMTMIMDITGAARHCKRGMLRCRATLHRRCPSMDDVMHHITLRRVSVTSLTLPMRHQALCSIASRAVAVSSA